MNFVYRKNTLYVYLNERMDSDVLEHMEQKVNNIMSTYNIENLVIKTDDNDEELIYQFARRYNRRHRSNVIIK